MIHELRHVRSFLKISETRNFTRAANDLHISQSALTVQIQQLEESLGIKLFDRNKRSVTLTAAGKEVHGQLQRLFNDAQAIVHHAHGLSSASIGSVTIAALPTVAAAVLPRVVRSFAKNHPGVAIQISDVIAERVREAVIKREADFGIGTRHGKDAELCSTLLFRDRLVVFACPDHPLAKRNSVTLLEAMSYELILPTRDSSVRESVDAIAHRERVTLEMRYETNYMPTALSFVHAGLGIAILPESATDAASSGFVTIPLQDRFSSRDIELLQRRDTTLSPAAQNFIEHLLTCFREEQLTKKRLGRHAKA